MLQCLDILMLKVGQSQDIPWLKTGQHTELRIHFADVSNWCISNMWVHNTMGRAYFVNQDIEIHKI